jgi:hypothetical protein
MQTLQSIAFQTVPPDKVNIYDDGAQEDLRQHPVGRYILPLLTSKGIEWEVIFTPRQGQHVAHEIANQSGFDFVWRLDDDNVAEPDVLQRLLALMADGVGAVAGAVYEVDRPIFGGTSLIQDFFSGLNFQWAPDQGVREVDILYGSFLYRAGIAHYKSKMSHVAFHEETIFTHRIRRNDWKLIVDTSIRTHHFKSPHGGTRHEDNKWAYAWDHKEFMDIFENEWGIKLVHLGVGLGDNYAFKRILPAMKKKYRHIILGTCYPEVFEGTGVQLIPYEQAKINSEENVYDFMAQRNWNKSMSAAYAAMYRVDYEEEKELVPA